MKRLIKGGVEYRVISDQVDSPALIVSASTCAAADQINYDWHFVAPDTALAVCLRG